MTRGWSALSTRLRLTPVLLIATLAVVAGFSMQTAHAAIEVTLNSRQYDGSTKNLGQMYLDGQGPYNLPYGTRVLAGFHRVRFIPPAGFYFVKWESSGVTTSNEESNPNDVTFPPGNDPTITAVYQRNGLPAYVGGVVLPTNNLTVLAPYLAMIGLVATAAVAAKKRRNWILGHCFLLR